MQGKVKKLVNNLKKEKAKENKTSGTCGKFSTIDELLVGLLEVIDACKKPKSRRRRESPRWSTKN